EDAAANLGSNRFRMFWRVLLPLAAPGIATGMLLVFILSISAFITPKLVGGNKVQMLGSLVYEQILVVLNWPLGGALSITLLIVTILVLTGFLVLGSMFKRRR